MMSASTKAAISAAIDQRERIRMLDEARHRAVTAREKVLEAEDVPSSLRAVLEADNEFLFELGMVATVDPELIYFEKDGKWGCPWVAPDPAHEGGILSYRDGRKSANWFACLTKAKTWKITGPLLTPVERAIIAYELPNPKDAAKQTRAAKRRHAAWLKKLFGKAKTRTKKASP